VRIQILHRPTDKSFHKNGDIGYGYSMTSDAYEKLRQARVLKKVTLKELAKMANLSYSYISQIERGEASPSLASLGRLAGALDMTVWQLLKEDHEPDTLPVTETNPYVAAHLIAVANGSQAETGTNQPRKTKLVKSDMRRTILLPQSNVRYQMITPDLNSKLQVILVEAEAGAISGEEAFVHSGEECCLILSGQVEMDIGLESFQLEAGDSLYFSSTVPHRWRNVSTDKFSMLLVVTPPAY
jgi:transcriptional regulator with XRE-family HTH domain